MRDLILPSRIVVVFAEERAQLRTDRNLGLLCGLGGNSTVYLLCTVHSTETRSLQPSSGYGFQSYEIFVVLLFLR